MILQSAIYFKGNIYTGKRHSEIIKEMVEKYHIAPPIRGVQGFVTETQEFLDRVEAREHFIKSGQKSASGKMHHLTELFSEDLY